MNNISEKLNIRGQEIWVSVDPHVFIQPGHYQEEYFTASYHAKEPDTGESGILFEENGKPILFSSRVEAVAYANEKLLGLK